MANAEDVSRAKELLRHFDALFSEHTEIKAELRAAGVSERRIEALYPGRIQDYARNLEQMLCADGVLFSIIGGLLVSTVTPALSLRSSTDAAQMHEVEIHGTSILDAILVLPEEQRPGQFILRPQHYQNDLLLAFRLVKSLLNVPIFLQLLAEQDEQFMRNLTASPDLGRIERMLGAFSEVHALADSRM